MTDEDISMISKLCSTIFNVFEEIPESLINAASGISGCGPAYVSRISACMMSPPSNRISVLSFGAPILVFTNGIDRQFVENKQMDKTRPSSSPGVFFA